ncbi:MAG: large-conductance mechanosensitive channel protein MscL [Clostridiaceae bacterium]|nr:large-conductance mechanosensitive channel protein MscL [Clostridiaceae bacterium]
MRKFIDEFKKFAIKGNMFDLAIGVIIGAAFSKIVTSLVDDVIMPVLSVVIGRINIAEAGIPLIKNPDGEQIILKYGAFINNIIDFLLISLSIFIFIRLINKFKRKEEIKEEKEEKKEKSEEIQLLEEIRDLLKEKHN